MIYAACLADPVLDWGIRHETRASIEAIENCHIHPDTLRPMVATIGNTLPRGICAPEMTSIVDQRSKFNRVLTYTRINQVGNGRTRIYAGPVAQFIDRNRSRQPGSGQGGIH